MARQSPINFLFSPSPTCRTSVQTLQIRFHQSRECRQHLQMSLNSQHRSILHNSFFTQINFMPMVTSSRRTDVGPPAPAGPSSGPSLNLCHERESEDDHEILGNENSPVKGGIVALGKFDALHIGHRELAVQASKAGSPFLLSFVGMAEVLGWETRAPIVANCDRKRVLSSWASHCGNVSPREFKMEFSSVRSLSPRQFVEKLVKEFGLRGVVAGENYRFGYRASGDASELVRLCNEYGIDAYIIKPVMDKNQDIKNIEHQNAKERGQVSSTRVRYALENGDMSYVSKLLGRPHRLIFRFQDLDSQYNIHGQTVSVPKSCLLNLPPKEGRYENCSFWAGEENPQPCSVLIDSDNIHLEFDNVACPPQDLCTFGIEFGA